MNIAEIEKLDDKALLKQVIAAATKRFNDLDLQDKKANQLLHPVGTRTMCANVDGYCDPKRVVVVAHYRNGQSRIKLIRPSGRDIIKGREFQEVSSLELLTER